MGRVVTNGMSLSFAREASLGVLPVTPQWFEIEPNTISTFGTTVSKEARSPISKARARRKGVVVDLDSAVEVEADLTITHLRQFMEQFLFARYAGGDVYLGGAVAGGAFTVPAISGAQSARLIYGAGAKTLIHAYGYLNDQNNGLKVLGAAAAPGATAIPVAGLVAETIDPDQMVEVSIAGIRCAVGDIAMDASGNLVSTALDFRTLGLQRGQVIHIGGVDVLHQFDADVNLGFARCQQITQNKIVLAKRDAPFVADAGTGVAIDLLFGQFVRNVSVDHPDFIRPSTQFELGSPGLMANDATGFEYARGNWADALSIAIPLSGKATITMGFVGINTTSPTTARAANANAAKVGGLTGAFGTASDIARLRLQDVDEDGLSTDFKSATLTLSNSVAGEKVLGLLGPKYLNAGDIEVDVESQLLFTNPDVIERIRCNKTVGFDFVLRNGDGGLAFDLPTGTLDGGGREYPANQSVLINTTLAAHQEDDLDFTLGVSFFPILPVQACA